ncbi:glycosyltransferase family 2 protein [Helicobacter marmotae]|uniref:glycosyltransferase family 2 protein n=1 Tax=Helicobacter marmotae TaxID=152490 RepID=UPI000CF12A5F|nr:glycosyltransferase family 2 protein [Helicobacter marmotae]
MPNKVLVSIIIPVYNVRPYLSRALESCINQTIKEIEILIIDDCGNDGAIEIAKAYAKVDERIHIIHNERNLGTFGARISGVKYAKGLYICYLDADDYLEQDTCKLALNALTQSLNNPSSTSLNNHVIEKSLPDIVFFGMRFEPKSFKRMAPPVICEPLYQEEILYRVFAHCATPPWHIWAKLYKASHMVAVCELIVAHMGENVRLSMAEDALQSFWLCALAQKSIGIKDKLYVYCASNVSITRKIDQHTRDKKIADISRVIDEIVNLKEVPILRANPAFKDAQTHTINILKSVRVLEHRYDGLLSNGGGGIRCLSLYLASCFGSLAFHRKWQTYVRIALALLTLGKIKI